MILHGENIADIFVGDCRESLKTLIDHRIKAQMCVTSPPYYGLRDYGHGDQIGREETPEKYINALVGIFRLVRDALADDGTLWVNIGDSYAQSGTAECKTKDLIGIPWMLAFALRADGWYLRQDIIWSKPNPMPESVRDRCTKSHEYIFMLSKSPKYFYDADAIKTPAQDWGGRHRGGGKYHNPGSGLSVHTGLTASYATANKRSVWAVATLPFKGAHFATFPPDLIKPCILAGSRTNDMVLDPFGGSGTTAGVALFYGRNTILCELNNNYVTLIPDRIASIIKRLEKTS